MSSAELPSVASRAVSASAWTVGTRLIAKLIDLAMLLCLARFLGPTEFGLVAMAMAAVFIVEALFELPMAAALIRAPVLTPDMFSTAFTVSISRGIVIALLLLAVAWPLAIFNGEPRLIGLLAVLALAPAMRGLISPRMVEYARAFDFRPDAVLELSGKTVAFVLSVSIAATTGSYWAIAAATVCGPLTTTLLSYCIAPMRPRLTLSQWSYFSGFIGWNFLSQLGSALNWQIDRLILPRLTTTGGFGQYAMGKQISEIPMQALLQPLYRPAMTALSVAGDNRSSRYVQLSDAIVLVMIPVLGMSVLWPEVVVRIALGPSWSTAAEWLRWISAVAVLGLPASLLNPLAMTLNRTRWVAVRTTAELLARLPAVWLGAMWFGIPGAIAGSAVATAVGTLTSMFIVRAFLDIGLIKQVTTLWRPTLAILPAGAILYFTQSMVLQAASPANMFVWVAVFGTAYVAVYAFFAFVTWHLAGRPAGLEQHVLGLVQKQIARMRLRGSHSRDPESTSPNPIRESNVENPR